MTIPPKMLEINILSEPEIPILIASNPKRKLIVVITPAITKELKVVF